MSGRRAVGLSLVLSLALGGCSLQPPKPWEKGLLAKREMTKIGRAHV